MSASTVKPSSRTTLLAVAGGVVGLALLFAFAVGLPELSGSDSSAGSSEGGPRVEELGALPDSLPGDLVSLLSPDMPADIVEQSGGEQALNDIVASGADNVAALYGEPAAFGLYGKTDGSALVTVTIGPGDPGLFVPDGTPISPEFQKLARSTLELVEVEDGVCSVIYAQPVAEGQPVDPSEQPSRVHCQLSSSGLLYDVTGQGVSIADTVGAGVAVRDQQEGSTS